MMGPLFFFSKKEKVLHSQKKKIDNMIMKIKIPSSRKREVLLLLITTLLLSNIAYASDIDAILNHLISLTFRVETFQEYERLINESLELFQKFDEIILENPPLLEESKRGIVNTSISGTKISALKEAAKGFVDFSLVKGKKVGLVSFKDFAIVDSLLSSDREVLHKKIDLYKPSGRSCIHCGILKGIEVFSESNAKGNDMVLISDGHSSLGRNLPIEAARLARSRGIKIHTISLGENANEILLREISEITEGKFYKIMCERKLKDIYRKIAEETSLASVLLLDISDSMEEEFLIKCFEEKEICNPRCLMNKVIYFLEPLYVTFILIIGIYLIFLSGTPEGRAKAKYSLQWLILSMCVITLSPFILTLLFSISHALTQNILSQTPENSQEIFSEVILYILKIGNESISMLETHSFVFMILPYLLIEGIVLMLNIRYFVVLSLSVLFPFSIMLYSFLPTRRLGRLLTEQTLIWIFSQIIIALVFLVIAVGINLASITISSFMIPFGLRVIMELSGLLILMITPFIIAIQFRGFLP